MNPYTARPVRGQADKATRVAQRQRAEEDRVGKVLEGFSPAVRRELIDFMGRLAETARRRALEDGSEG